jgi:Mg-chelatase subunit ChlD
MEISFLHPFYLFLLAAIPLLWFLPRRAPDRRQGILRSLLMAFIIIALARPVLLSPLSEVYQVFIIDRSESVSAEQRAQAGDVLATLLGELPARDKVSLVIVGPPEPAEDGDIAAGDIYISDPSASALSAALEAASQEIPEGSRGAITLISDGLATDRRWGSVVQTLIERGIPVSTFDMGIAKDDIYPSAIHIEPKLRVGQTAKISVDVIGAGAGLRVRLAGPGGELALSGPFDSEGRATIPLEFEPAAAGFLSLTVEVIPSGRTTADRDPENNRITRLVAVQDPIRVLYLGDRQLAGAAKLGELVGPGFEISDAAGKTLSETFPLGQYDLVMLDDRPAETLPEEFQEHLVEAVRTRGLGLLFSGGKASFGGGGYYETAIAEALPVEIEQRDEKRDPSVSLAIIIDTSGSMMGRPIEIAKQIARLAIRNLQPQDRVGIVEFYGAKHWAFPMQPATNTIEIERAIGRMQASGGTVLYPAVEEAYYGLKNMRTRYKHVLLITDAMVEDADYETIIRRIARDGIGLSTVMVGRDGMDGVMFDLAAWGRGRYYSVSDRYSLPDLTLKQPSTTKLPAYQPGVFPVISRGGKGWWGAVDPTALPAVSGYAEVKSRPGAEVLIEDEGRGYPVLASWRHGQGRVTALMTEPLGAGTESWRDWQDYGEMLGRLLSRTASDQAPIKFEIRRNDHMVRVTARRRVKDDTLKPEATIFLPNGEGAQDGEPLDFQERAPGLFEVDVVVAPEKEVQITAGVAGSEGNTAQRLVSMALEDVFPETQVDPRLGLGMDELARATGGVAILAGAPAIARPDSGGQQVSLTLTNLAAYFLILALLTYLGELIYRRWSRN